MIRKYNLKNFLIILLSLSALLVYSQKTSKVDSLTTVLSETEDQEKKADLLLSITELYRLNNSEKCIEYGQLAYDLSLDIDYPEGQAKALNKMGDAKRRKSDYAAALKLANEAELIAHKNGLTNEKISALRLLGAIYLNLANYEQASIYSFKSLEESEKVGDKKSISKSYSIIALIYYYQHDYENALEYYKKSFALAEEIGDKKGIARDLNNLANTYRYLGDDSKYEEYLRRAIMINTESNNQYWLLNNYINLAEAHFQKKEMLDSAMIYKQYAYEIAERLGSVSKMSRIKTSIGSQVYNSSNDADLALSYAIDAFVLADSSNSKREKYMAAKLLNRIFEDNNNYDSAYKYANIAHQMKDSLEIEKRNVTLAKLESQYKLEKAEQELQIVENKTIFNWVITAASLFIVLILVLFLFYRDKVKSKYALLEKQKLADDQVRKSEEKFRGIFDSMEDVFSRSDMEGKCVLISPSIFNLVGYRPEEIIGKNLTDFYARPAQRFEIFQKLKHSSKVENFEIEVVKKDGEIITVSTNAKLYYDESGQPLGIEGIFRDITEQKKAESEHNKLFNFSFDLLCIAGFDGYFKELNPAWEKVTGYTRSELKEKPFLDFIHEDDRTKTQDEINRLLKGGHSFNFENRYVTRNGQILHLSWTATPLPEENLMYCIARDISDQKASEQKVLEHEQRLKDMTHELTISEEKVRKQIAADLHDNVGQMLASIRMQLSRITDMEENPELSIRMKSISQGLLKSIQATRAAIFDLSSPQLNEIGMVAAMHDWMNEQIEKKHNIITTITGEGEELRLEENMQLLLFRSIKELMMNTVKHAKASQIRVTMRRTDNILEIDVEDDGVGFNYNPDLLRLKSDSYGLFSIQERISNLGGSMEVNSVINKGTLIKLTVPLYDKIA